MNVPLTAHEFELTDAEFDRLRQLVHEHTGIALSSSKRDLVYGRLARRLRFLKLGSFAEYCTLLDRQSNGEIPELISAITTNLTAFFRENHHFEQLRTEVLPQIALRRAPVRRIRLWSAGCSTGEEPYSLAMVLFEAMEHMAGWDIKILATDIDAKVVAAAKEGVYRAERLKDVSAARVDRWFPQIAARPGFREASSELKALITFRQLNLLDSWPMQGPFDVILCRNVVIYFDKDTQRALFERVATLQEPDSWLFLGHSENLFNVTDRYKPAGRTVYRRLA